MVRSCSYCPRAQNKVGRQSNSRCECLLSFPASRRRVPSFPPRSPANPLLFDAVTTLLRQQICVLQQSATVTVADLQVSRPPTPALRTSLREPVQIAASSGSSRFAFRRSQYSNPRTSALPFGSAPTPTEFPPEQSWFSGFRPAHHPRVSPPPPKTLRNSPGRTHDLVPAAVHAREPPPSLRRRSASTLPGAGFQNH